MSDPQRNVLKMDEALSAIPLDGGFDAKPASNRFFSTGLPDLDATLGGGILPGSFLAVIGPRGSGKTALLLRIAKANGIVDSHDMHKGTSDMLSILERTNGKHIGSLLIDSAEPYTDKELADMERDPAARGTFLARWFRRSSQIVEESGGLFVISAVGMPEDTSDSAWISIPDYIIRASAGAYTLAKTPAAK